MSITLLAVYSRAGRKFLSGLQHRSQSKIIMHPIRVLPQSRSLLSVNCKCIGRNFLTDHRDTITNGSFIYAFKSIFRNCI